MGEAQRSINTHTAKYRMERVFYPVVLTVLVVLASISLAQPAHAQAGGKESIALSPSSSKFTIDAGSTKDGKLTIVNDGTVAYDLLVYARPYSVTNNAYENPNFTSVTKNADLYGWVRFPQSKIHMEPNTSKDITYTIAVPAGAAPGGHYGVIFAEIQSTQQSNQGNSVIRKKRVGSLVYATVNGEVTLAGNAIAGSIPFWQLQPPLHTTVGAKNTGNTDFTNKVRLTVRDVLGNIKYQSVKDYQVLPDTTRAINADWEKSPWFGFYKVETEQKFLDQSVKSEGYVLMMPRYIPVAVVVIILIGGVYAIRRRKKE